MLIRLYAIPTAFLVIVLVAATCNAQFQPYPNPVYSGPGGYDSISTCPSAQRYSAQRYTTQLTPQVGQNTAYRDDLHQARLVARRPDVNKLDQWADKLAEAAKHLHKDAHELGQDYEHSQGIESYVTKLDRLNEHMHEILHRAADRQHLSNSETRHISNDVLQVRRLAIQLDRELEHQRFDGARTNDFHALDHMRQVIANEIYPLVRNIEFELDFRSMSHRDSYDSHRIRYNHH